MLHKYVTGPLATVFLYQYDCSIPSGKDLKVHPKMYSVGATLCHLATKTEGFTKGAHWNSYSFRLK